MTSAVNCKEHGPQPETFVCQHVVETLRDGRARGFHWSSADGSDYPDAWCSECNEQHRAASLEWTPEVAALAGIQLLCAVCYERAKSINGLDAKDRGNQASGKNQT